MDANLQDQKEILDRILTNLRSDDAAQQRAAIADLGTIRFSSEAVVTQLERLALGEDPILRQAALEALSLQTSQFVSSKLSSLTRSSRQIVMEEIATWEEDGLIEPHRAEVVRRRYDFDTRPSTPIAAAQAPEEKAPPVEQVKPVEVVAPARPVPGPSPTLTQALLSETSIRIYLYLGAFLVIAAAAILAALVEAARLPVLLIATTGFAAGAVGLRNRLPQPSFALAIVFSFLLPIDANVIADQFNLNGIANSIYWTIVFLAMAAIWAFGTWFYQSRLFSLAAFVSLVPAAFRFSEIFDASVNWSIFHIEIATLVGLLGVYFLQTWQDKRFARPLFVFTQISQSVILFTSLIYILVEHDQLTPAGDWIAGALTWILAASFYVASDFLVPFVFFPWLAGLSLFILPWLILSTFKAPTPLQIAGFAFWGTLYAFASEFLHRSGRPPLAKYHFPLLGLSLPLFIVAITWGTSEDIVYGFAAFLVTFLAYTILNILRTRWYVWLTALLFGLGAYFTFFSLPLIEKTYVAISYQLLGASLLLLIPELFFKAPLSLKREWSWPLILLGVTLLSFNLLLLLEGRSGRAAVILGVYTLLFGAYAWRLKSPLVGYLATASAALCAVTAFDHYNLDWWLPALTGLSVVYYATGFLLAPRESAKGWASMLIYSGLGLGALVSLLAVATLKETGGWYTLVVAALFIVEMYARRNGVLELFAELLLSITLVIILNDLKVTKISYTLFGVSLVWISSDAAFQLLFKYRKWPAITRITTAALTGIAALFICTNGELNSGEIAICFGIYTLFAAAYAGIYREPWLGYIGTTSAAVAVFFTLAHFNIDQWLYFLTGLAALYYAVGYVLRRANQAKAWDVMLLFSGLSLGTLLALLAPSQDGGLEKAIPIAIVATLFAIEAFARKNVWLGFPANLFYLISYFTILDELNVDEPQFYTVGAAALGLLMHYLLRRAGSKTAAFITGTISQLILLGASYIQMVDTGELKYFFVLFFQALAVLAYGAIFIRSRSLTIAPVGFLVLAVITILYNALKDLSLVFIIGVTGLVLLGLGILAVVMRERITDWAERFGDWDA